MAIEKGDFIKINYIGRIKETKQVFDTTYESVAKEHGIYDENVKFKPVPIVVGASHVIPGVDEALIGMEVGEKKTIEVPPEKGYGKRDPKKIRAIPLKEFLKQGIKPVPGTRVNIDNEVGKILSVGAGRVTVDFNHELAGKTLEYEISIEEKVNKDEEKIRYLVELHFSYTDPNEHEIKIENGVAKITIPESAKFNSSLIASKIFTSRDIFNFIEGIKKVEFIEVYEKKEEKKEEEKEKKPAEAKKKRKPRKSSKAEDSKKKG